jgi:lipopolysaccharide/colanic/teichoic acid biosynthesis glycosyltransferase
MRPVSCNQKTPLPGTISDSDRAQAPANKQSTFQWMPMRTPPNRSPAYLWVKAAIDRCVGLVSFLAFLPVMAVAAVLVRLTSNGPAVYSQIRVGRAGQPFWIYKLRTMYHNCEALSGGAKWSTVGDKRVTPIGKWLRRLHVDELPQLWNVVRGDMSLVGPRPERPEFVGPLDKMIPGYSRRLHVKPGVTGLAQIQRPADTDVESVRQKLKLDICYIERLGASLDARIMMGTLLYLAGVSYADVRRIMRFPVERREVAMTDTVLE